MKSDKLTRRDFIKKAAFAGAGLAVSGGLLTRLDALAQESIKIYLPLILKAPSSRVIHVHDSTATYWDFGSNYYGNYVRQEVVNNMVDQGVMALTGAGSVAQAWDTLFKAVDADGYQPGQKIAIKVNFNNAFSCNDSDLQIDALIHPVNAIVRGLREMGVAEGDIWVYEAVRRIPNRFVTGCLYSGVQFFARECCTLALFNSSDPNASVVFSPPSGIPVPSAQKITDVLIEATYLINMPIIKKHDLPGVTLGFKNHLGTINNPGGLHEHIGLSGSYFRADYNPLVDIYQNPHIKDKTILTIGDGLFGGRDSHTWPPTRWTTTFGNQAPNSLFFATDPVAIDCVMCDLLDAEVGISDEAYYYLQLAAAAGLGVFERGDPWGSGYSTIDYVKIEL
jgi:uncharacterized protein (DUF362 family)